MLYQLADHAPKVLTHGLLPQRVGEGNLPHNMGKNLRRKLGNDAADPRYIFADLRVGYWIVEPDAEAQDQE